MNEHDPAAGKAAIFVDHIELLGTTPKGLVRVKLRFSDGTTRIDEHPADLYHPASPDSEFEKAVGAALPWDTSVYLREAIKPQIPSRLFRAFRADTLKRTQFEPVVEVIPRVLPAGLAILAGKPKVGKSWLALNWALEVAWTFPPGKPWQDVLYLALEDPPRRLKDRMEKILRGKEAPSTLMFHTAWPRLDQGGLDELERWLSDHVQTASLVVVDTVAKIRPPRGAKDDAYLDDYGVWGKLQTLTVNYPGIAVLCVHHQRKTADEDVISTVLGSQGVTGVADTILVLKKARGQADGELFITGRDITEQERALKFEDGVWTDIGEAAAYRMSEARSRLVELLTLEGPLSVSAIARALGQKYDSTLKLVQRAEQAGFVKREGQKVSATVWKGLGA